jgi:NET1-associated nuclear protein 1 (U3 small nucleolar RNA-associated protein 17)
VVLYDPLSNRLHQTIALPECKTARSCHFIGRGARYLAICDEYDLVIWDLLGQTVRWHHRFRGSIMGLYVHSLSDYFAVFQQKMDGLEDTTICIFSITSSRPCRTVSLPFRLLGVVPYFTSTSSSSFTFVGIRENWSIVMFGDNARDFDQARNASRLVNLPEPTRKTLFQDIFGKSSLLVEKATAVEVFDRPSYLVTSMNSLFDPLMESFLKPRPEEVPTSEPDAMDVDEEESDVEPLVVNSEPQLGVHKGTMDMLVTLFKVHSLHGELHNMTGRSIICILYADSSTRSTPAKNHRPITKPNGVYPSSEVNGTAHDTSTPKLKNATASSKKAALTDYPAGSASTSPVTVNGKKRKAA